MKQIIKNYSINTTSKTITLTDFTTVRLDRLQLITNTTLNSIIYNFADSSVATATVATNVITLSAMPGGMTNTDSLMIVYDAITNDPTYDTPPLPSGAATAANQTTANTSLSSIATNTGNIPAKGQAAMSASTPVAIASDQSAVPVSGTFWQATQPVSVATLPALAAGTNTIGNVEITDGTNTASILKSDGTAAGQNSQLIAGSYKEVTYSTTTAQAVASTDVANYTWVSVHINTQGTSSTVAFQQSNDNTNWFGLPLQNSSVSAPSLLNSTSTAGIIANGPLSARYFRLNVTGISAGTTAGTIEFYTHPRGLTSSQGGTVTQSGTWTVGSNSATGSAVPANAFYIGYAQGGNLTAASGTTGVDAVSGSVSGMITRTYGYTYNGSTYDSFRGNLNTTTGDTGAKTTTFAGATQTNFNHAGAVITILLGTVSGTSPTLSAQLQWSPDAGTTWLNLGAALANLTASSQTGTIMAYPSNISTAGATPAALTTGATQTLQLNTPLPRTWRLNYTIGGTTPSFTISSVQVNYIL
jgi:hypothetical protein